MSVKWLFGYRKLRCDKTGGVRILNIMMRNNIEYWGRFADAVKYIDPREE